MLMHLSDWRSDARYAALAGIDRAGLMWEWLRRDPDYVAWFVRASSATRGARLDPAADPLQWGLHFRRTSDSKCARSTDHLARGPGSRNALGLCL